MIMDSWRVLDGHTDGLELHLERFTRSVRTHYSTEAPAELLDRARAITEDSFPRLLFDGSVFHLDIRPLPALRTETTLLLSVPDQRRYPLLKGPDMPWLLEVREHARAEGADEAVLTHNNLVVEATTSTVLLVEGDTLVRPLASRLASVTEELLIRRWSGPVIERPVTVEELPSAELLALSALHGVTRARVDKH